MLGFVPNEEAATMIMSMGFERNHVISALKATENNLDRALDWIMSHGPEDINNTGESSCSLPTFRDGQGGMMIFKLTNTVKLIVIFSGNNYVFSL